MNLQFNPGDGAANLPTLHKGLSLLTCRSRTMTEVESAKERDETMARTEKNRQLADFTAQGKSKVRPAEELNIDTFMGLVWVLFGNNCPYYTQLKDLSRLLQSQTVMINRQHITPDHCRRITWAI